MAFGTNGGVYIFSQFKEKIKSSDDLCKLLFYNTPDALDRENLAEEQKESLFKKQIEEIGGEIKEQFPIISQKSFLDEITEDSRPRLKIYTGSLIQKQDNKNLNIYICYQEIWFEIMMGTQDEIFLLDIGVPRDLYIASELIKLLNGEQAGVGTFSFAKERGREFGVKMRWGNNLTGYLLKGALPLV